MAQCHILELTSLTRSRSFRLTVFAIATIWLVGNCTALAQQLTSGSGGRAFRDEAISSIPVQELNADAQVKINDVINNCSFYRRLPVTSIEVDPEYFVLLTRYPEIVVETWRLMGVTQMETERTGPFELHSNDGAGTISDIELLYGTEDYHLFYGSGSYDGPLNRKPLDGKCLIVMRTEYAVNDQGIKTATNQLDVFLKVDHVAASFVARTLSPIVGRTADHNFVESLKFVQRLNETTEKNGPGVQGMAYRLSGLTPEVRQLFIDTAGGVFERKQLASQPASATSMSASAPTPIAPANESSSLPTSSYVR
ncbi:MAG: hypothetical protein R3C03_09270 [Pirellulaceae bacterium]